MRATLLFSVILLTKAHRTMVSIMAKGCIWPEYCLLCVSYFYYPTIPIFSCVLSVSTIERRA